MPKLKECPACGNDCSAKADACPACGHPLKSVLTRPAGGCLSLILLATAIVVIIAVFGGDDPTPSPAPQTAASDEPTLRLDLCMRARAAVTARLKAPSTASFPNCVAEANRYDIRITPDHKTAWVIGYVDSQNAFGAMLRARFGVKFDMAGKVPDVQDVEIAPVE